MNYKDINRRHPDLEALDPFSVEWYRQWRKAHLAKFPEADQATRDNLDAMVTAAEAREAASSTTT